MKNTVLDIRLPSKAQSLTDRLIVIATEAARRVARVNAAEETRIGVNTGDKTDFDMQVKTLFS